MKKFSQLDCNALIHGVPFISLEKANQLLEARLGETAKPPRKGKKNGSKRKATRKNR